MQGSSYYHKQDNIENARKVKEFYLEVLKEFSERLEKEI